MHQAFRRQKGPVPVPTAAAQHEALVSVGFRSTNEYGWARFSRFTLVGTLLAWSSRIVMRSFGIVNGVESDSTARFCVRGDDGAVREIPMRQAAPPRRSLALTAARPTMFIGATAFKRCNC